LAAAQTVVRVELGQGTLQALAKHKHSHFHFLFTGDESWMFSPYNHRTMFVTSWDDVDGIERPSHFQQKTVRPIFFSGTGEDKMAILPPGQQTNSTYFMECVLGPLTEVCSPEGRKDTFGIENNGTSTL
jgi:hypothetical protein